MKHLPILGLAFLLLSQSASGGVPQIQKKQWQDVPSENHDAVGGAEYTGADIGQYQSAGDYTGGGGTDIANYGSGGAGGGYSNDYHAGNNGYSDPSNTYGTGAGGYVDQNGGGYTGGEQIHGGAGGAYVTDPVQGGGHSYSGDQVSGGGGHSYSGDQMSGGGGYAGADIHSTSYSSSGYGDMSGHGYAGAGYSGDDGYGAGVTNEGWERPVKTVVKHVLKNIAVPHPVPAPVHVPVPKYVKYFKPFAIAKPVAVPHVIPVIKHIQKPIPFFASVPVKHTVPVPKFVGLPVQVRVPRPVFIHVPKVVPVAKKVHIPIHVNIPKPYIVPVYKHVPVPVPHKVPKVINVIKEVPHYVKKPVPVYVDDHPSFPTGGNTLTSSSYSNHYGNAGTFDSFSGAGYGNEGDLFGGSQDSLGDNSFNNAGGLGEFGQQGYSGSHSSLIFNNPFIFNRHKLQRFRDFQSFQQPKLQVASQSYPRAHRQPNKGGDKTNGYASYQQQQGLTNYNYSSNVPGSSYGVNTELIQGNSGGASNNYNSAVQQAVQQGFFSQGQGSALNEMFYQNMKMANQMSAANNVADPVMKLPLENINSQFSQPVYDPSAYAEYAMNSQGEYNHSYSQPYSDQKSAQNSETASQNMVAQASKPQFYNQHPENAYSLSYSSNYQNGGMNNIPQMPEIANFNNPKNLFAGGSNIDLNSAYNDKNNYGNLNLENEYKASNPFTSSQGFQTQWPSNGFNQDISANLMQQMQQQFNQQKQAAYSQASIQSNLGYNQGFGNSNFNINPSSYSNGQDGYQQTTYTNNENNPQAGFQQTAYSNNENNPQVGYQQNAYVNNENNHQVGYQQNAYVNNENNPQAGYQQNIYANNENNPQAGYQQTAYVNSEINPQVRNQSPSYVKNENNPRDGYQQTAFSNNGNNANINNFVPSGSSSSSTSYSESPSTSNQDFQTAIATNSFIKQNEKYDQSSSQSSYTSDANIALPGVYSNSAPSVSYSSSSYRNNFNNMQGYNQQTANQDINPSSQVEAASQLKVQSQFNDLTQITNPSQFSSSGQFDNQDKFRDTSILNNPSMFNNFNQLNNQNQANNPTYLNQQQSAQPVYNGNSKYDDPMSASYANFVNTGPSSTYDPQSTLSTSYSSSQSGSKSEFSPPAEKSYLLPSKPLSNLGFNNNNKTEPQSNNNPSNGKHTFSTSYSYSYTENSNKPEVVYTSTQKTPKSHDSSQTPNSNKPQSSKNSQFQYSPQIKTPDLPSSSSSMDEMEKHIQSSASSIINVYTNSPESMGGKKGHTFSFMDPVALGSSQSTTFFQPQDPDANPKLQYNGDVGGPAYRDPAEPLQTSLDAYVPRQPVYNPSANDQNTVYKEAMSEIDDYKEAISLNSESDSSRRS